MAGHPVVQQPQGAQGKAGDLLSSGPDHVNLDPLPSWSQGPDDCGRAHPCAG
jgi:hypothetical protein